MRESFGVLDRDDTGLVSASELRHVLMNMGEKLAEAEVRMCFILMNYFEVDVRMCS